MQTDKTRKCGWASRIWAAFIFLTRIPFWRLYQPPKEAYTSVVEHWPLVGWLTSCIAAAALYLIAPHNLIIGVLAAIILEPCTKTAWQTSLTVSEAGTTGRRYCP